MSEAYGWWFFTCQQQILVIPQGQRLPFGSLSDLPVPDLSAHQAELFAHHQGEACWRMELPEASDLGMGEWLSLRDSMAVLSADLFDLTGKAMQFALFLDTHRFCGRCGERLERVDWELAMQCHSCGFRAYPRISPSIIVLIRKGEQLLLAKHRRHSKDGRSFYTAIAGFVEAGENFEQAVVREVREETGLRVRQLEYWKSQPWAFPHSIMAAYFAEFDGGKLRPEPKELLDAQWFSIDELPDLPPSGTIARAMIERAVEQIQHPNN